MLKRFSLFIAIPYTIALVWVSLVNLKDMPDIEINYLDKIVHFLMYAILCLLWFFVFFYKYMQPKKKAILNAVLLATIFGIILEVLQGVLTSYRSLDVYDAIANTIGAFLTGMVLLIKDKLQVKNE